MSKFSVLREINPFLRSYHIRVAVQGRNRILFHFLIIESVDSISRDGPDMPYI